MKVKSESEVTQLCPTLSDPMDYRVHGILQATILERVAFPSPGDLPNPGIEPRSPALQADSLLTEPQFWLCWVFIALDVLSLVAVSEDYSVEVCSLLIVMASLVSGHRP